MDHNKNTFDDRDPKEANSFPCFHTFFTLNRAKGCVRDPNKRWRRWLKWICPSSYAKGPMTLVRSPNSQSGQNSQSNTIKRHFYRGCERADKSTKEKHVKMTGHTRIVGITPSNMEEKKQENNKGFLSLLIPQKSNPISDALVVWRSCCQINGSVIDSRGKHGNEVFSHSPTKPT